MAIDTLQAYHARIQPILLIPNRLLPTFRPAPASGPMHGHICPIQ